MLDVDAGTTGDPTVNRVVAEPGAGEHSSGGARPLPWRRIALQAAAMWAAVHVALALFTYFAVLLTFQAAGHPTVGVPLGDLMKAWLHYDGNWYIQVARQDYASDPRAVAFFPLYPLLIRVTVFFTFGNYLAAALLVSNLAMLGAFVALGFFAAQEDGPDAAPWILRATIAYPLAFFLAAPYTESLFLALAACALLAARRGTWRLAVAAAFLAGFTRLTAIVLVLPLAWEYGRQAGWWEQVRQRQVAWREWLRPRRLGEAALVVGAAPVALGLYYVYTWVRFGPHALQRAYAAPGWGHVSAPIWQSLKLAVHGILHSGNLSYDQARLLVDLAPVVVFTVVTLALIRRMPLAFTLYMLGLLYLCVAAPDASGLDPWISAGRYLTMSIPIFLQIGRWSAKRPWVDMLWMYGGILVQAVIATFFLIGGWLV